MQVTNEFKPEASRITAVAARLELPEHGRHAAYVGLDLRKEIIAVVEPGRQQPRSEGEIANRSKSVEKLVQRLSERFGSAIIHSVYEAGPVAMACITSLSVPDTPVTWWRCRAFPGRRRSGSRLTAGVP